MSSSKVCITGINGFVGEHMAQYLFHKDIQVLGIGRRDSPRIKDRRLSYEKCDLLDLDNLTQLFQQHKIQYIIHLAADNNARNSWDSPIGIVQYNMKGAENLLEAVRQTQHLWIKGILMIGSAHEYGINNVNEALTEISPEAPLNPYGWSKLLQTKLSQMYAELYSLPIIVARTFNLVGPGITSGVCSQLAQQVVEMERGKRNPKLTVGNLDIQRDFLDVRDAVHAYWSLLQKDTIHLGALFNVCKGSTSKIKDIVHYLNKHSTCTFSIVQDPTLLRSNDPLVISGDNRKLYSSTGWQPSFTLETTMQDILTYQRLYHLSR